MTHLEIVMKLIGKVRPVGETNEDKVRLDNLKQLCELVDGLLAEITQVSRDGIGYQEASIVRATKYANEFIDTLSAR